jgi:hypothetical protein
MEMKSFAQPQLLSLEIGFASLFGRGSQQIHCQYTPRPHRSVTKPVPYRSSRLCLRMRVIRSCGSRFPTLIPRSKSIQSVLNAAPVGISAAPRSARARGSQSLAVAFFFIAASVHTPGCSCIVGGMMDRQRTA